MSSPPFGSWPPPTTPVTSVFGRIGAVVSAAGDYTSTQITNASAVAGATVTAALNALATGVASLTSTGITNLSSVAGANVTIALNTLASAITAVGAAVAALTSSSIANASGVAGASVTAALNTLSTAISAANAAIAALTSTSIANASGVVGATVTAALNTLSTAISAANAAIAALTSSSIANASGVAGATVTLALNALSTAITAANAAIAALTSSSIANASGVTGASVTAALNALLAAIPSVPVASVFARTGAVVATSGDYTSTLITNASAVTGATVTVALNTLRDSVWNPPTTPSADDDEFTSDVLASGAWHMVLAAAPGTAMVRDGGINLTQPISPGHYRSEWRGTLLVQIGPNETALMWKQFAGALTTSQIWFIGIGLQNEPNSVAADYQPCSLQFYKDSAGLPDLNNRSIYRWQSNAERCEVSTIAGGVTAPAVLTPNMPAAPWDGMACRVDHSSSAGTNFSGFPFRRNLEIGSVARSNAATVRFNSATDKVGITFRNQIVVPINPIVSPSTSMFAVKFIRRVPEDGGWLAQN